ncbi:RNA-directed DNA polymerase from mobile element jockey [Trichonephila clavipes]|nr:RNA-directed DNA polymerase from mobile element jockey [Trichonephila clavipes]
MPPVRRKSERGPRNSSWQEARNTPVVGLVLQLQTEQSAALRNLSDVLDEARFKFSHQRKQKLTEQTKLLQAQIAAYGLPPKPFNSPFQVVLRKKGRKATETEDEGSVKKQRTDITSTQNRFAQLSVEEMDITAQAGTSTQNWAPGLLKHLQDLTKLKLESKLIGTKLRISPQTAYAYHLIRKYEENSLESYTYILPEDKKFRLVIKGLPTDMPPIEILSSLAAKNITSSIKTEGKIADQNTAQCFRCQGFFHSSRFCTRTPRCVKCAGNHLAKECSKSIDQKPKCCLCEGEHPASFLGCPRNPRNKIEKEETTNKKATNTPAPPKVNFWEQRAKNATPLQQPNPSTSKKPSQATPSSAPTSVESAEDIFDQLNSPAVRETFDLLEEFIKIATTIPTESFIADWNPDIVYLQETHLQPCHNFIFPDDSIYRTDGTFRGGGTAVMIKRSIPHHQIFITNNNLETTAIKLIRLNEQPITIVSAYRPPRKSISDQDLHRIFRNQGYVLVAGDLNAKYVSWSPLTQQNVAGNIIRRFCDSTGYSLVAPPEPFIAVAEAQL